MGSGEGWKMAKQINGTPAFEMSRVQAAHHIDIGVSLFDALAASNAFSRG
jgi:hypothetical protein